MKEIRQYSKTAQNSAAKMELISRNPGVGIGIGVAIGIDVEMSADSDSDPDIDRDKHKNSRPVLFMRLGARPRAWGTVVKWIVACWPVTDPTISAQRIRDKNWWIK